MIEKKKLKDQTIIRMILICFGILVIESLIMKDAGFLKQILVLPDEFGYWSNAVYLLEHGWKDVMENTFYYSYGYSLWLIPIVYFFDDPAKMYLMAILLNAVFLCIGYLCGIFILDRIQTKYNRMWNVGISLTATLYVGNLSQTQSTWSETLLYSLVMVIILVLISYLEKHSVCKLIVLSFLSVYIYTVHQRAVVFIIALCLLMMLMLYHKDIKIRDVILAMGALCVGYMIQKYVKGILLEGYSNPDLVSVNNYSGQVGKVQGLFNLSGLIQLGQNLLGQWFYLCISSLMLIPLGFLSGLRGAVSCLNKKVKCEDQSYLFFFLVLLFLGSMMVSAIFLDKPDRMDMVMYGRYIEYIAGPFLLLGLSCFFNREKFRQKMLILGVLSVCCVPVVTYGFLQPGLQSYNAFGGCGIAKYFSSNAQPEYIAIRMIFILLCFWSVIWLCHMISKKNFVIGTLCIGLCFACSWLNDFEFYKDNVVKQLQMNNDTNFNEITEYLSKKKGNVYIVYDDTGSDLILQEEIFHYDVKYMQFLLPDRTIECKKYSEIKNLKGYFLVLDHSEIKELMKEDHEVVEKTQKFTLFESK